MSDKLSKQENIVLTYWNRNKVITSKSIFLDLGIVDGRKIISNLGKKGIMFHTRTVTGNNRYGDSVRYNEYILSDGGATNGI